MLFQKQSAFLQDDAKSMRLDFQEGILTLPIIYTLQDSSCKELLKELIEKAHSGLLTDEDMATLDKLILKAGGFEKTVQAAENHRQKVLEFLTQLPQHEKKTIELIHHLLSKLTLPKPQKK